jgi:hypothetical protein
MIRISLSPSHSSSASTTRIYEEWQPLPSSFNSGSRTSSCHWSRRDRLVILLHSVTASEMYRRRVRTLLASCTATLVTNLPACPTSPPPRVKKKLAPRRFWSKYLRATVRAIVDFPVPAKPFSQKMQRSSCPSAQPDISRRSSTRVLGRQASECCFVYELNGASTAYGKRSSPELFVSARFDRRGGCQTRVACLPFEGLSISSWSRANALSSPSP